MIVRSPTVMRLNLPGIKVPYVYAFEGLQGSVPSIPANPMD